MTGDCWSPFWVLPYKEENSAYVMLLPMGLVWDQQLSCGLSVLMMCVCIHTNTRERKNSTAEPHMLLYDGVRGFQEQRKNTHPFHHPTQPRSKQPKDIHDAHMAAKQKSRSQNEVSKQSSRGIVLC